MDPNRRACLRTIGAVITALPISTVLASWRDTHATPAVPALLIRQVTLHESQAFADAWPQKARLDFGRDVGEILFGPKAVAWDRLETPVLGLTTASALFCLEQVAATCGVRTLARISSLEAGSSTAAAEHLRTLLNASSPRRPLVPELPRSDAANHWVAWYMAPRTAQQFKA